MTKIIGHRGARGLAQENSLEAFKAALDNGVDEIELDVRVSKDGVCVLNHDPFLRDATGARLPGMVIAENTFAKMRKARPGLITLEDAIKLINREAPIVIEVKPKVPTAQPVAVLKQFLAKGWKPDDFLLCSFSQSTLQALHQALPELQTVVNDHFSAIRAIWRARRLGSKRINLNHHMTWWGMIKAMHRRGYQLTVHTLNNPKKAKRWAKLGLYGVVTDFPDRFRR